MKNVSLAVGFILSCAASFTSAAPTTVPTTALAVIHWEPGVKSVTIAGAHGGPMVFVPVALNGKDAGWFLVDTGSTESMVDRKVADQLGLGTLATAPVKNSEGLGPTALVRVDDLRLGDQSASIHYTAGVLNSFDMHSAFGVTGLQISGIIGMDLLTDSPFQVDFRAASLTLFEPGAFTPPAAPAVATDLKSIEAMYAMQAKIEGQPPAWFTVDTGATGWLETTGPYFRLISLHVHPKFVMTSSSSNSSGLVRSQEGVFSSAEIFGRVTPNARMRFTTNPTAQGIGHGRTAGTVEARALADQQITFDGAGGHAWSLTLPPESTAALVDRLQHQSPDRNGFTPLMCAAMAGRTDAVLALLDAGEKADAHTSTDETAIWHAATRGDAAMIAALIKHGADPNVVAAMGGTTPLMLAATYGNAANVRALLDGGAKPDTLSVAGDTALFLAAEVGSLDCVKELLKNHAVIVPNDKRRRSALLAAATLGHTDCVTALLDAGADPLSPEPVMVIAAGAFSPETMKALLDRGLNPNVRVSSGPTALMSAAYQHDGETVRLLLAHGADPTLKDQGKTAFDLAVMSSALPEVIRALLPAQPTTRASK